MNRRIFSLINRVVGVIFVAFAIVQYNDADQMYWMLFYGLAAFGCLLFMLRRLPPSTAAGYAVISGLLTAFWVVLKVLGQPLPGTDPNMTYEVEKEIVGFLLVGAWMSVLYFRAKAAGMY